MAAFRKPDREGYYVRPTLPPPWGRVGPWATGFRNARQAEAVETWLQQIALERPEIIDALVAGKFGKRGLQALWVAKVTDRIDDLLLGLTDPLLAVTAAEFGKITGDARVRHGLTELAGLAHAVEVRRADAERRPRPKPGSIRLSWLLEPRNVSELYQLAVTQGRAPNSVRRSIHRAVADLLAHHFRKARRDEVMREVQVPGADDEREVRISPDEIGRLLAELDADMADMVALAMLLAVDRDPLLRISPRFFDEDLGTLEVLDRKTSARPRTIELSTPAWAIIRRRAASCAADEPIFRLTPGQVRHAWEAARDRAAGVGTRNQRERGNVHPARQTADTLLRERGVVTLPVLRFKDLRHLLPTAWNALGFPEADLQQIMGHARGSQQTRRYITARISGDRERMDQVAGFLGLDRLHLRASGE